MIGITKTVSTFVLLSYIISIVFSLNFNMKYNAFLANQLNEFNGSNAELKCKVHCFLIQNKKIDKNTDSINDIGIGRYITDKHLLSVVDYYFSINCDFKSEIHKYLLDKHPKLVITPPPEPFLLV